MSTLQATELSELRPLWVGDPHWMAVNAANERYPRLREATTCDVLVVGGGIGGAMMAYHLAREGFDVVVVDRRQPTAGSTSASTALLQYELDTPLIELIARHGDLAGTVAYQRCVQALTDLQTVTSTLDDDCGLRPCESLYLAGTELPPDRLAEECTARSRIGIRCNLLSGDEVRSSFGVQADAAIRSNSACEVDPVRLTRSLLRGCQQLGARVYGDTGVSFVDPDPFGVTCPTQHGVAIRAKHVVFATGYEMPYFVHNDLVSMHTTFAAVTEPIDQGRSLREQTLIWEASDPYFYARTTPDHRLIIGGEDVPYLGAYEPERLDRSVDRLVEKARQVMPSLPPFKVDRKWCGAFAETEDGLPIIDRIADSDRVHVALGYGGNGITFSLIAAQAITNRLSGKADPFLDHVRIDRQGTDVEDDGMTRV